MEATTRTAGELTTGMEAQEAVVDTTATSSLEAVTTTTARAPTTRVALEQVEATANHRYQDRAYITQESAYESSRTCSYRLHVVFHFFL